ncbi:MAG: aromatic amino acid ammonia-lyase [Myxococcota bacterium]|nr:aromatic amino acid ammonia-lyase [Myxococcota bacterium]
MIRLDGQHLSCAALHAIGHGDVCGAAPGARAAMSRNAASTPAGEDVLRAKRQWLIGPHARGLTDDALARAFIIGHCAGVGDPLPRSLVRAAIAARANVLLQAVSGCRPDAVDALLALLEHGVVPTVPAQGSVGAAGDLAPMAHIARVACGWGPLPTSLPPFKPTPKEALALINGVSLTAAIAAFAVVRARRVLDAAIAACAMTYEAVGADMGAIDPRALAHRGHPGAVAVGAALRGHLSGSSQVRAGRHPDAFSLRCAPQVLGAASEALDHVEAVVTRELNGASDNPLLFGADAGAGEWVEAGNFHGAALAQAMDTLKIAMVQVATVSERRTFRLTYGQLTPGLPSFLVEGTGLNSGFMLAQYTAASLASEAKGLAHPASVDAIPTVQHHEDHNSMGTIAGRMALRILECVADIVGIEALLASQALDLRERGFAVDDAGAPVEAAAVHIADGPAAMRDEVRGVVPFWEDDQVMHPALAAVGGLVRHGGLLGDEAPW